jgi:dihydrofolate reductase
VFCGASLDGFIAGFKGEIEWLDRPEYASSAPPGLSYEDFIASVDTLVMGRNTFDKVLTFNQWPYEIPVVVLTTRPLEVPDHLRGKARPIALPPRDLVAQLASDGKRHLYVDGGLTIQSFLKERLIHEITVTYLPVLLGAGISLFGTTGVESLLTLLDVNSAGNGFVQVRYRVENARPAI